MTRPSRRRSSRTGPCWSDRRARARPSLSRAERRREKGRRHRRPRSPRWRIKREPKRGLDLDYDVRSSKRGLDLDYACGRPPYKRADGVSQYQSAEYARTGDRAWRRDCYYDGPGRPGRREQRLAPWSACEETDGVVRRPARPVSTSGTNHLSTRHRRTTLRRTCCTIGSQFLRAA